MAFTSMQLKPESGAYRIKSADDAYSFMVHMRLSYQNKPHWQVARQALNHAGARDGEPFGRRLSQKVGFWIRESLGRSSKFSEISSLQIAQPRWTKNLLRSAEIVET
jgi:hypothetical protein